MITAEEIILRLLIGAVLGGIIGFERQAHGRPAGFRTQLLVCVASVLFMIVSEYYHYLSIVDPAYMRIDPARIAQGAITGVGFLGAGVILKTGFTIQGLTTAACIWVVSAVGVAIGAGLYLAGAIGAAITVLSLWVLRRAEKMIPSLSFRHLIISGGMELKEDDIASILQKHNASVTTAGYERDVVSKESVFSYTISYKDTMDSKRILDDLASIETVHKVSLRD